MTAEEKFKSLRTELSDAMGRSEGEAAARILMEDIGGFSRTKLFTDGSRELLPYTIEKLDAAAKQIISGDPVQYAVGRARFHGMDFDVRPGVLIPRPETEGLVDLITDRIGRRSDLRGLDACTGSGCIAVALARNLPFSHIEAFDISPEALEVAIANARRLAPSVRVYKADALNLPEPEKNSLDFFVSNPPYILPGEAKDMDPRVLDHEPKKALFVADNNPLEFYTPLARYAFKALAPGGMIFIEINSTQGPALRDMLAAEGFDDIEILPDYKGNIRYAVARKS